MFPKGISLKGLAPEGTSLFIIYLPIYYLFNGDEFLSGAKTPDDLKAGFGKIEKCG